MDRKYWHFPENKLNLQFELVRWWRFLATETKSKQHFNLIRKDWVLVYWNRDKSLACRSYRKTHSSRFVVFKNCLKFPIFLILSVHDCRCILLIKSSATQCKFIVCKRFSLVKTLYYTLYCFFYWLKLNQ